MKRFLNKKYIIIALLFILTLGFIIFIIMIKSLNPFKPSFYAYSSYTDPKTKKEIEKNYTYKEYSTVTDFEYAFNNNKAIAGITSDYSIISLINQRKIAPIRIELTKLNNLENDKWESYWTNETVEQMHQYDSYISDQTQKELNKKYPYYGENYKFKFSDFVVPYFINDRVIAFNTKKLMNKINLDNNPLQFQNIPTLLEALNKLFNSSNEAKMQWTKNERENAIYGATINNPKDKWDTNITLNNYQELVDNFVEIVDKGTGYKISDIKHNLFESDSNIILNNLISPLSSINIASIYNGDALDAYYGHDNFNDNIDGDRVRIIRTKYNIRVLDAFVVSSSISNDKRYQLLSNFNKTLFNNMFIDQSKINNNMYLENGILRIFDFVNYTICARTPYEFIYNNYFKNNDGSQDEIARSIFKVSQTNQNLDMYAKGIGPINQEVLTLLNLLFQKKLNGF